MAMQLYGALLQIPNVDLDLSTSEYLMELWSSTGFMIYPLAFCLVTGIIVIIIKFISLTGKAVKTKSILKDVDELLTQQRIQEALELTRDTDSPAANILYAGLERNEEGTERVMKAIENQGLLEMSKLESGLTILATLTNIAPLLGFLGTVIGMIIAFQSIEAMAERNLVALATSGPNPEEQLIRKELVTRVEAAVATLPENQRLIFVLGTQLGMRYREIGEVVGCSEDAVKVRIHRARKKVRDEIKSYLES